MGVVYLAQHPVFGRKVAIKLLHAVLARDQDIVARFFNEARAIHMVAHENIVEILDFGQTPDGQPYFIMEYLSGESLSDAIARGPMTNEQVEAIGVQMCKALSAAHAKGIVHRDLKPHNVQLVIKPDGALVVKILDFGVAKLRDAKKDLTGEAVLGTPYYMSPEQATGYAIDARSDIYSLGITAFHLLTGRKPFEAKSKVDVMLMQVKTPLPQIAQFVPCDERVAGIVEKMCAKKPGERYQSCDELIAAIDALPRPLGGREGGTAAPSEERTRLLPAAAQRARTRYAPPSPASRRSSSRGNQRA